MQLKRKTKNNKIILSIFKKIALSLYILKINYLKT